MRTDALQRRLLNAFIAFHLVAILATALPAHTLLMKSVKEAVFPYMRGIGLFQEWDMFAPEPLSVNSYLEAEVTYRDGRVGVWKFPRMEQLGYVEREFKERYRKFANDRVRIDANSVLWPDVSRYIARVNGHDPSNPPVAVRLVRYWSDIPAPRPDGTHAPAVWGRYVFFAYAVLPGDLS